MPSLMSTSIDYNTDRLVLVRHVRRCHKVLLDKKARGEKFLGSERYVQMHKLKQECITRGFVQYASPRDKVLDKLMDPLMNVPLNLYAGQSEPVWKAITYRLQELLDTGDCYEKRVKQYIAKLRGLESERISKCNDPVTVAVIIIHGQAPQILYLYIRRRTDTSGQSRKLSV